MPVFPRIYVSSPEGGWLRFPRPQRILAARRADEVADVISEVSDAVAAGQYAAGFVGYEAASAFDFAHRTKPPLSPSPPAWFALADSPPEEADLPLRAAHFCGPWRAAVRRAEYCAAVRDIQKRIAAGDVYQVNFTFPLRARFAGCPLSLFAEMCARQPSPWRFFAETEEWAVCSASPECFFERRGGSLRARPMKGTRPAGRGAATRLAASEKDRAENLMIVDMLRNDMSRLPDARRVRCESLLRVREYPTVAQMTSTVVCETDAGLDAIFAAMFPCASVTGAPKIAAMALIASLEKSPRGAYCGACGWAGGGVARFNVAIRTAFADKRTGVAEYGIGSGVVADSSAAGEWRECRAKAAILTPPAKPYLIETMRAEGGRVALLSRHLSRLAKSARHFGVRFRKKSAAALVRAECNAARKSATLRLHLTADGNMFLRKKDSPPPQKIRAVLSPHRADSRCELLRHKTTRRAFYEDALSFARAGGFDDAVLQNERGEITETCIANIAAKIDGEWRTPPVACGLLPGVMRESLLAKGALTEKVLHISDLRRAEKICRLNAVRGKEEMTIAWDAPAAAEANPNLKDEDEATSPDFSK